MVGVKILPKYQITIPSIVRKKLNIHLGETLVVDVKEDEMVFKKGKTIYDYIGTLPNLGMEIAQMREKAIEEAMKDG